MVQSRAELWAMFAAARLAHCDINIYAWTASDAARSADEMLAEFDKRFVMVDVCGQEDDTAHYVIKQAAKHL